MNNQANRKRLLWIVALGGVFLLALAFISLFAPSTPNNSPLNIRPETTASQALDGAQASATPATSTSSSSGSGFSLGGGQLFSLAWRLGLAVVIIAGSIFALRWWGKKTAGPRSTTGFIRVIDTLAIGNGRTVHLLAMGDRVIVVGATAQQLTFLNELTEDEAQGILARSSQPADQPLANFAAELFQSMRGGRLSIRRDAASVPTEQLR